MQMAQTDPFQNLKSQVEANALEKISLQELASKCDVSLATFKRHFSKAYGTSPHKYLKAKRLEKAKALILEGELSVSQVYKKVGFEELAHFSKSFKAHFGVNPSRIKSLYDQL
jgi:transcriptional regulator GlxA family with amidase domain